MSWSDEFCQVLSQRACVNLGRSWRRGRLLIPVPCASPIQARILVETWKPFTTLVICGGARNRYATFDAPEVRDPTGNIRGWEIDFSRTGHGAAKDQDAYKVRGCENADRPKYLYPAFVRTAAHTKLVGVAQTRSRSLQSIPAWPTWPSRHCNGRHDPLAYRRRWGPHSRGGFRGFSSAEGTARSYRRGLRGTRFLETGTTTSGRNSWQEGASACQEGIRKLRTRQGESIIFLSPQSLFWSSLE